MSDLAFHIRQFVPDCQDGDEMEQRQALLKARDYAVSLIPTRRELIAMDHAIAARDVADAFVFADVPVARLKIAVSYCRHLVQCAFISDHLEREAQSGL
jgi:hypothetical protein